MPDTRYLVQRRKSWYVRVAVPPSLRDRLGQDIVRSLKTRSLEEAQRRRWKAIADIKDKIDRARTGRDLMGEASDWSLERDKVTEQNARAFGYSLEKAEELMALDEVEQAEKIERTHGEAAAQRWIDVAAGRGLPISVALNRWLDQSDTKEKTKAEQRRAVEEFISVVGDMLVGKITRRIAAEYVERLREPSGAVRRRQGDGRDKGRAPATVNKQVSALSSLWRWLKRKALVEDNVWSEQSVKVPKAAKRPYRWDELRRLLDDSRMTGTTRDAVEIALFTGMRIEEVARLRVADIEDQGIHVRDGKTDAAVRWVPLEGRAWDIVSRLSSDRSEGYVLDQLQPGPHGSRSHYLSKKFGRIRDAVLGQGMGQEVDFHSLRRTYAYVGENVVDAILLARLMGHEAPTLATKVYSGGAWRERLREAQRLIVSKMQAALAAGEALPSP